VEIDKKIKILVPVANMNNYEYNEETLIFEKEKKVIKVGDIVTVTVTKIKYEKKEFGCIGKL
jgi:exoribonuclease R